MVQFHGIGVVHFAAISTCTSNWSHGDGRRAAIVASLQRAIRDGRLPPGARLPSSRALAADLGVARGTVAEAYDQLVVEGWLAARQGSGTAVAWTPAAARTGEPPRGGP